MRTPINDGLLQSDLDCAGFDLLNFSGGGTATSRKFDVKTYGAAGDAVTNDTAAIQAALAAIPAEGGVLYFPAGRYIYTGATLIINRPITVEGDGGAGFGTFSDSVFPVSSIRFNSPTVPLFTIVTGGNSCTFKNIALYNTSVTTPTAGAGILVLESGGYHNNYQGLTVDGFYIGIDVQSGSVQHFDDCYITAPVLYGLKLSFPVFPDAGDHFISNCSFNADRNRAATSAIRIESGGGPKIVNCKVNSRSLDHVFVNGIDLAVANNAATVDLLIANCSIEAYSGAGIKGTTGTVLSSYRSFVITGNQFSPVVAGSPCGIDFTATPPGVLSGLVITGNWGLTAPPASSAMIRLSNCSDVMLSGNAQTGFAGGLLEIGSGVTFSDSPTYIGRDARLVSITGGAKLQVRNPGTGLWADGGQWTNP